MVPRRPSFGFCFRRVPLLGLGLAVAVAAVVVIAVKSSGLPATTAAAVAASLVNHGSHNIA